jgi:hypothetical protein
MSYLVASQAVPRFEDRALKSEPSYFRQDYCSRPSLDHSTHAKTRHFGV